MVNLTRTMVPKIVAAHDFSAARVVMDVGGGTGELIGGVLKRVPHLDGITFDLARCEADAHAHFDQSCVVSDLNMLRGPGGRERTFSDCRKLVIPAGFIFTGITGIGPFSLVEFKRPRR
ncbi:methyltransferase [Bradyrhizobium liaoningense]|uniref:methyltransferase n=1 Tax=Bradyrhizobium liaoningense TaxID=43992 RepID=UPI001FEA966F|nr:methyltransferase [Bradyrhizobium liaoningense]